MISFSVPEMPRPKQRPRAALIGVDVRRVAALLKTPRELTRYLNGRIRAYTPKDSSSAEEAFAWHARAAMGALTPIAGPVLVGLRFRLPYPKTLPKWRRLAAAVGLSWPDRRVDLDNLEKLAKDAMNGIVWDDDFRVMVVVKIKCLSEDAGTDVVVVPLAEAVNAESDLTPRPPPIAAIFRALFPGAS